MSSIEPETAEGRTAMAAILAEPTDTLVAVDFDGTLAPIVDDPEQAYADPATVAALERLGGLIRTVVILTGRPAETAVRLGRLRDRRALHHLLVLGQYGVERWDADRDEFDLPPVPDSIREVEAELPELLRRHGAERARIEEKGRALAVHTRGLPDPGGMLRRLTPPLRELVDRHDLQLEPGRNVLEIRPRGMDKGLALRRIVAETGAKNIVFAGDDLGDLPAFEAVAQLRREGLTGLLVCSASNEEQALAELADVVVDGPAGVAAWMDALADAIEAAAATPSDR